jgi:phosphodiesterase/alkaline phosphatase D-like protein
VAAYWAHQRAGEAACAGLQIEDQGAGWRLFMADSRTQRSFRSADTLEAASILGEAQTARLETWLLASPPAALKIVTSAAMLLPRRRVAIGEALYQDGWSGYPGSLHRLLAFACTHQLRNLVFLSGDAHLACSARVTVRNRDTGERIAFASHHAPALYAPYPFANEQACNLARQDRFGFRARLAPGAPEHRYECTVESAVLAGGRNGVGLLHARRVPGRDWDLGVEVLAV